MSVFGNNTVGPSNVKASTYYVPGISVAYGVHLPSSTIPAVALTAVVGSTCFCSLHHAYDPSVHGTGIVWSDLAVLAIWAVAGLGVALRRFGWTPATAHA